MSASTKSKLVATPKTPLVAVDTVVFRVSSEGLFVLLIQVGSDIYKGKWAIPGGLVHLDESLEDAAVRVLTEKANLKNIYLEQLYSFGEVDRDKRGRSISVAYFALVPSSEDFELATKDYYQAIEWFPVVKLPELAFDHKQIIETAYQRLESKLSYSNIAYSLLPNEFTLTQLQSVYEMVLGRKLDKRNFRKKMLSLELVEPLTKKQTDVVHRPALLFKFKTRKLTTF